MAVTDLLVGLIFHPFFIENSIFILSNAGDTSNEKCSVMFAREIVTLLFGELSFCMSLLISIDRFLAIFLKQRYRQVVTKSRVIGVVLAVWLVGCPLATILIRLNDFSIYWEIISAVLGIVFLLSTLIFYKMSFKILKRYSSQVHGQRHNTAHSNRTSQQHSTTQHDATQHHSARQNNTTESSATQRRSATEKHNTTQHVTQQHSTQQNSNSTTESSATQQHRTRQQNIQSTDNHFNIVKYKKSLTTMVIILGCLLFCCGVFLSAVLVVMMMNKENQTAKYALVYHMFALLVFGFNSTVNPVIYLVRFRDIRRACREMISRRLLQ